MRKQTIIGYIRKGWTIQLGDFGMIDLPLANVQTRLGKEEEKVKITIENCKNGEEGVIIENEMGSETGIKEGSGDSNG